MNWGGGGREGRRREVETKQANEVQISGSGQSSVELLHHHFIYYTSSHTLRGEDRINTRCSPEPSNDRVEKASSTHYDHPMPDQLRNHDPSRRIPNYFSLVPMPLDPNYLTWHSQRVNYRIDFYLLSPKLSFATSRARHRSLSSSSAPWASLL